MNVSLDCQVDITVKMGFTTPLFVKMYSVGCLGYLLSWWCRRSQSCMHLFGCFQHDGYNGNGPVGGDRGGKANRRHTPRRNSASSTTESNGHWMIQKGLRWPATVKRPVFSTPPPTKGVPSLWTAGTLGTTLHSSGTYREAAAGKHGAGGTLRVTPSVSQPKFWFELEAQVCIMLLPPLTTIFWFYSSNLW